MVAFTQVINIVASGVTAFGTIWVAWGLITLGVGFKDKTGPEIKQGFGTLVGGAMVVAAAAVIASITM